MRRNVPLLVLSIVTAALCLTGAAMLVEGIWLWPQNDFSELSSIRQVGPAVAAAMQSTLSRFATVGVGAVVLLAGLVGVGLTLHAAAVASSVKSVGSDPSGKDR